MSRLPKTPPSLAALINLAHELGREDRRLAILGEGNVSARVVAEEGDAKVSARGKARVAANGAGKARSTAKEEAPNAKSDTNGAAGPETFWVKASGSNLATLDAAGLTECRTDGLLAALDQRAGMSDAEVDAALLASRVASGARAAGGAGGAARKPSVEAMFHAWLLTLPGVNFVGHTHPVAVNAILCSAQAQSFASRRLFPDEIVCCGPASVFVPYVDPGLKLAQAIRRAVLGFVKKHAQPPRVILLENHGLIALGATAPAVLATSLMATKAAEVFLGAASLGGPQFLSAAQVKRIAGRPDEKYREQILGLR